MIQLDGPVHDSGRRQFLRGAASSAVLGVAAQAGLGVMATQRLSAQSNLSPDAALQELVAGNQRFAANGLTSIEHDHVDIYPTFASYLDAFERFVALVPEHGLIVANAADEHVARVVRRSISMRAASPAGASHCRWRADTI